MPNMESQELQIDCTHNKITLVLITETFIRKAIDMNNYTNQAGRRTHAHAHIKTMKNNKRNEMYILTVQKNGIKKTEGKRNATME